MRAMVIVRILIAVGLLLPTVAWAQFTLDVTQIHQGPGQEDERTYHGACAKDACRATIPLQVEGDVCVLNLRVSPPDSAGNGQISQALGPCRSGRVGGMVLAGSPVAYHVDHFGAASVTLPLVLQPSEWNSPYDDGVVRATPAVRLDIIANQAR
jgi:hypothetical protein